MHYLTILKIVDVVLLMGFVGALIWSWRHINELRAKVILNEGMPRDATRGLIYGLIAFLLIGFVMVHIYWLLPA